MSMSMSRFFGLFGVYYSLQYLSLSDATVLTFLAPLTTAIAGALLLGESFTLKQASAGSMLSSFHFLTVRCADV
jgi:drug/metabolite transporter (DMT)-like permease